MSKIGDLFVRLGLKKDEFSKGIQDSKRELSSLGSGFSSIASKGKIAFAAVTAAIVGVVSAVKDLAKQNQTLGDEVRKTGAGFSAMFDTLKTSVASMDFSHLLSNLREANQLARDLYDAQDALGEIGTGYNMALARQLKHINELKIALRDQTLSDDERISKGEELLRIYRELEKNPTRGYENVKDKTLDYYMQRMGVNMNDRTDEELAAMRKKFAGFFEWLGTKEGEIYNNAAKQVAKSGGLDDYLGKTYMANAAKYGREEYARLAVAYNDKIGDKDRLAIEQAVVAYYQQEAKYSGETLRIQTQINSIKAQQASGGSNGGGADADLARAEKIYKRAQDSGKARLTLLAEQYENEKALLEKYQLDTEGLWEEYSRNVQAILDKAFEEITLKPEIKIEVEPDDIDLSDVDEEIQRFIENFQAEVEQVQAIVDEFANAVVVGFSDACQEMMDQLFGLQDFNPGQVVKAMLTPLADMAIKAGEIIMAEGIATEAANSALKSFGETGWAAVAAGAALVAAGAAAKSGLAALAQTGGKNTSASTYSGSSGSTGTQQFQTEMTVYVKGTIRGSDIVLSGQKTVQNWGR